MRRFLILLFAGAFLPAQVIAQVLDVEAEKVVRHGDRIEASGRVVVQGEDLLLRANYVVLDTVTEDLWAAGDCHLEEEGGEMDAHILYYNNRRKDFRLEEGTVFVYADPIVISGRTIVRYGEDVYEGEGITYTPCLGKPPDWSIAAGTLNAPLEGYGSAYNARFRVGNVPLFYVPYLLFPLKLERQSGLLFPGFGHSTDTGYRTEIPLYIVLGRSMDATITPTHLSDRGLLWAGEFRYRLDEEREGFIYGESLFDKRGGEVMQGGVKDRIPDHRWLLKARQTGGSLTWDINLVSHADYLRDIGPFYGDKQEWKDSATTGVFEDSENLEELVSRVQWNIFSRKFSANLSGQWKQDLTVGDNDRTLQELPRLRARMRPQRIPHTPVLLTSDLTTVRVYSRDWIEAVKNNGEIELSWPISLYPYLTVLPSFAEIYRDTFITDHREVFEDDTFREHWQERSILLTTALYSERFAGGIYHQVVPSVSWVYLSRYGGNYDRNDPLDIFPDLLENDDWEKEFDMNLSLENYVRGPSGRSLAEFTISRSYSYIDDDWKFYEARARLNPVSWFSAQHTNRFGREPFRPYATHEHWSRITFRDARGDELYAAEEYVRPAVNDRERSGDATKSAYAGVNAKLIRGFSVRYEIEYDFLERRYEHSRQGLSYASQCWSVDLYREVKPSEGERPRETTISLLVNLLGFGQILSAEQEFGAGR
ncbi:MAG: hypothetical protein WDA72_09530 [Desulfomonilia bacterium]|jgi:LPS-assembly protein|nr:hypothetical protein [Desulfomonilia bacterium]HPW68505.1 hypothetical protein [Deltaproteobacteria bacterium]